jgi:hypothetical protein
MNRVKLAVLLSLCGYLLILFPFAEHLTNRPLQIRVGYVPEAKVLKFITADQRYLAADWIIIKVLLYFGELMEKAQGKNIYASAPDYSGMFRILQTGLRIEPYNADAYYFAEAAYSWDVGQYRAVDSMLEYGMKYRTWDSQLPFFVGFNEAYFLKDYKTAAGYMKKAAEIAKDQQFATIAARYFYDAGENDLAILFLDVMRKSARNDNERKLYAYRLSALLAARDIQTAVSRYLHKEGHMPKSLAQLVIAGVIAAIPEDPYGGVFYLDGNGRVQTTSKFSIAGARKSHSKQQ